MNDPSLDRLQASMAEVDAAIGNVIRSIDGFMSEYLTNEPEEFPNRKARRKAAALARRGAR
mgnify:CR=1 FL=1